MRRSWIKIETNTPDKPEICVIASQLRLDSDTVMGKLIRLWAWAELNVSDCNETAVTFEFIDKLAGKKGFAAALEKAGWLKRQGEMLVFPNFSRHNGRAAKSRAQTAQRVSRHRKLKAQVGAGVTAEPLQEVEELEANEPIVQAEEPVISHGKSHINNDLNDVKFEMPTEDLVTPENRQEEPVLEVEVPLPSVVEVTPEVTAVEFQVDQNPEATPSAKRKTPRVNTSEDFVEQPLLF